MTDTDDFSTPPKPKKKRRKMLIVLILLLLSVMGGGGYLYFFDQALLKNLIPMGTDNSSVSVSTSDPENAVTYDHIIPLDEIIINIRDREFERIFKLSLALELVRAKDNPAFMGNIPVLLDSFQSHLRGLRVAEIEGSRAIYRIKEELISRANIVLHPVRIKNILFSEFLIQ